jgi:hypothetical protein
MRRRVGWIALGLSCAMLVSGCTWIRDSLEEKRAARALGTRVQQELARNGALAAELELGEHRSIQGSLAYDLERRIARRAAEQCRTLSARHDTPYVRAVVRRYCAHFGEPPPVALARPHEASGVDVTARVDGVSLPAATELIERAFRGSCWYDPAGARAAAELSGELALAYRQSVQGDLHVGELLPPREPEYELYRTTETVEETEVLPPPRGSTAGVGSTCLPALPTEGAGRGGCGGAGSPGSSIEPRTRVRTLFDLRPLDPTRYRIHRRHRVSLQDEPVYMTGLQLRVALPASGSPFRLDVAHAASAADADRGAEMHDLALLERDAFLRKEGPALVQDLTRQLDALWIEQFCADVSSPEAAARCIHGPLQSSQAGATRDPRIQAALGTLRTTLGEDLVLLLVTRAPAR